MKNIAFIHKVFPYGGAERISIDIAGYCFSSGYRSYVFTWKKDESKLTDAIRGCVSVIELPDADEQHSLVNAAFVVEQIVKHNISVLIIQGEELPYLPYLKEKVPTCKFVFSYHGKPMCEALYEEVCTTMKTMKRSSFWQRLNWKFLRNPRRKITNAYKKPVIEAYWRSYKNADAFVVLCESYKEVFINALGLSHSDNKIVAISNPEKIVEKPNLQKKKQVIFVGRMTYPDKRVDRLLYIWKDVYAKAPDWELLLIGDGPEKSSLESLATRLDLKRVSFVGHSNDTASFYENASVLCLTSATEGWPLCLTEAQANGVIPIAFGCSAGVKEILSPSGVNGFIVPSFNLKKYAKTLVRLLNDPALQREMQKNVILKSKEYSIEVIGPKWKLLFERLLRQ